MGNKISPFKSHISKYPELMMKGLVCGSNMPAHNDKVMTDNTSVRQMMRW